jgi:protein required for attachment to host cells
MRAGELELVMPSETSSADAGQLRQFMKNKLLIVADLGRVKAYKVVYTFDQHTPRLEQFEELVLEDARNRMLDKVTDEAGRHISPAQKKWGAPLGDENNLKLELKRRLVHRIAEHIEALIERSGYDGCWLAAHKEINQQILEELPPRTRNRIWKNLPRDLTKLGQKELLNQFLNANSSFI